ncbi:MAG TPA: CopG family transcriptional regulator [Firmicutes bacterium]|jgi:metal-responsive CopG/Arc/MetJ family transcriptional regulator|nr:CopG family transcriptional regulator [Bacillota bacterium]
MIDNHTPGMILSSQEAIIMARITISIPEDLLGFIDSFATERELNRSNAVAELVRKARKRDLEAELERGYKEMAEMNLQEARQAFAVQAEVVLNDKTW